jgi:isoquinoline 1-oxidoreductase beta subunit
MTGYATLLAEELDVSPAQITLRLAPVDRLFQDPLQLTGESKTMRSRWLPIRATGARARQMLLQAAAIEWQTDVSRAGHRWCSRRHRPAQRQAS